MASAWAPTRVVLLTLAACLPRASYCQTPPLADSLQLGDVTFSGSFRTKVQGWDWFQPSSGDNIYAISLSVLRFGFSQDRGAWGWNAEFAVPILLGLPADPVGSGPQQGSLGFGGSYFLANGGNRNTAMIFPKQLYVKFNSLDGSTANKLQIGRFEFIDGSEVAPQNDTLAALRTYRVNGRLISNFGITESGRSMDGISYSYAAQAGTFEVMAAVPTRGVFQVDGWGWNRIGVGYASFTREWSSGRHLADTRLFAIEYDDWRHIVKVDSRPAAARAADLNNIRINTFGGHTAHVFDAPAATFDALLWAAAQTGRWGLLRQRAGAVDGEAGIQPKLLPSLRPWLRGGYFWGSGDGNPNDNTHGTFFQILPNPRPFARFPFFNMMNNEDAFAILILRPHPKIRLDSEFHSLRLASAADLWYSGGGAFQPWTFGYTGRNISGRRSLANLYDTSVDYRVNSRLTLIGYGAYAQGLAAIGAIYPTGKDARFGYLEALFRF
jgi:hypothetical protein